MNFDIIRSFAGHAAAFVGALNWRAKPSICLEFGDIHEFARARADIHHFVPPELTRYGKFERTVSESEVEYDIGPAKLRFVCKQQMMRLEGPEGAVEASNRMTLRGKSTDVWFFGRGADGA